MKESRKKLLKSMSIALLSLILCLILCFALVGCGTEGAVGPKGDTGATGAAGQDGKDGKDGKDYTGRIEEDPELPDIVDGKAGLKTSKTVWESANGKFYADYATYEEEHLAAKEVNIKIAEEGFVLMKNANNALPLSTDEKRVSVLGYRSYNLMTGGSGSGAGSPGTYGIPIATMTQSLNDAGFVMNPSVVDMYAGFAASTEVSPTLFPQRVVSSYASYHGAAILTFSRGGAEGTDVARHDVAGNADKSKHALELNDNEVELVKHAKANFDKVIVLINSSNCFELGELDADRTDTNLGVDAILWIGQVGNDGAAAIGRVLNGTVNPSGHTVDTWECDFTKGPTYTNMGGMTQNFNADNTRMDNNLYVDGAVAQAADGSKYHSVEYREGIYMGYRYYETKAYEMNKASAGTGDAWYKESVVYPFGFGLSYTTFDWKLYTDIAETATIEAANSNITMHIKVTNTGDVAGKDVVQIFVNPPYTNNGIEKSSANLVAFAKTKLLKPGESEIVKIKFVAQDMASFDWNDANGNGFVGYELEKGSYIISANSDAHTPKVTITRTVANDIKITTDYQTGNKITPQFTGEGNLERYKSTNDVLEDNLMSRTNMKQPVASTIADRSVSLSYIQMLNSEKEYFSYQDTNTDPWYIAGVPTGWTQAANESGRTNGKTDIRLKDLMGVDYTAPTKGTDGKLVAATDNDSKLWETFMNQLTWYEMVYMVSAGDYGQGIQNEAIGKELVFGGDGPTHFAWNSTLFFASKGVTPDVRGTNWVSAVVMASTWNVDLASEQGRMIGNESLLSNINDWYGPGANTHRSPFSGRNFEYYSEDGVLAGKLCAAVTKAVSAKGVMTRLKHMFLNDQETNRNTSGGVLTWCTEQAIREIYLKPFEISVKEGDVTGGMTAFNRIGDAVCSTNYALLENVFRGEWNFEGTFVTDCQDYAEYRYLNLMTRTGQELPLGQSINMLDGQKIYEGRFGIGYASCVEGTWDAAAKCVKVAANKTDAQYCETARKNAGDMRTIYSDAAIVADLAQKETVVSPTHYYAVRKSAQRILHNYVNTNAIKNGVSINVADQEFTMASGTSSKSAKLAFDAATIGTSDFLVNFTYTDTTKLPTGFKISANGTISGIPSASLIGTHEFAVSVAFDGWVRRTVTVKLVIT